MSDTPTTTTDAPASDNHPPAANDNAKASEGSPAQQNPEVANENAKAADQSDAKVEASQNGGKTAEGAVATRDPMAGAGQDQAKTPQPGTTRPRHRSRARTRPRHRSRARTRPRHHTGPGPGHDARAGTRSGHDGGPGHDARAGTRSGHDGGSVETPETEDAEAERPRTRRRSRRYGAEETDDDDGDDGDWPPPDPNAELKALVGDIIKDVIDHYTADKAHREDGPILRPETREALTKKASEVAGQLIDKATDWFDDWMN